MKIEIGKLHVERVWNDYEDDCYYMVLHEDYPVALTSFDTSRQAQAFIQGWEMSRDHNQKQVRKEN